MTQLTLDECIARARPYFEGPTDNTDTRRLTGQLLRIASLMDDGRWRTLPEIATATGDPEASVSAQLRHMRKPRFGSNQVEKRRRTQGLWEYRVQMTVLP